MIFSTWTTKPLKYIVGRWEIFQFSADTSYLNSEAGPSFRSPPNLWLVTVCPGPEDTSNMTEGEEDQELGEDVLLESREIMKIPAAEGNGQGFAGQDNWCGVQSHIETTACLIPTLFAWFYPFFFFFFCLFSLRARSR